MRLLAELPRGTLTSRQQIGVQSDAEPTEREESMARARKTKTTPPPSAGSQMWKHEDLVDYIEEETGEKMSSKSAAEVIGLAFKYRTQWRKTSRYEDLVEAHREEAQEARKERQKERRASSKSTAKKAPAKKKAGAKKAPARRKRS